MRNEPRCLTSRAASWRGRLSHVSQFRHSGTCLTSHTFVSHFVYFNHSGALVLQVKKFLRTGRGPELLVVVIVRLGIVHKAAHYAPSACTLTFPICARRFPTFREVVPGDNELLLLIPSPLREGVAERDDDEARTREKSLHLCTRDGIR